MGELLGIRATLSLRVALPAALAPQLKRPRNVAASALVGRGQARHLPGEVLDLPPQGRDLRRVLRPLPLVLRGQLREGSR